MTEWDRPLYNFVAQAEDAAIVYQAGRDLNLHQVGVPWQLIPLHLKSRISVSATTNTRHQPSKLLRTRDEVVEFSGRANEVMEFLAWRDLGADVLVRLLHAPGGEGKTRFARHLAHTWGKQGWITFDAQHARNSTQGMSGMPVIDEGANGVLIVIDYAERWPEDDLVDLIRQSIDYLKRPLRLLLLSRPAGVWWEQVEYLLDNELGVEATAIRLDPLGTQLRERMRAFLTARKAFAKHLDVPNYKTIRPPKGLFSNPAYSHILKIHMAALAAVDAHHRGAPVPADPARLSSYLLRRERDHWRNLQRTERIRTDAETLECAVYAASLCGPMRQREAVEVAITMDITGSRELARSLVRDHAFCYPAPQALNGVDSALEPLQPDQLAEDFVALTLPGHDADFTAQSWAAESTKLLLDSTANENRRSIRGALTTLIEMATRWRHIATDYLSPLLRDRPSVVLECGNATLATLADNPYVELKSLQAVASVLRRRDRMGLGAAAVLKRVILTQLKEVEDPAEEAALRRELTAVHQVAGLVDQAVDSARDEVAFLRSLAEEQPNRYTFALADALFSLCAALTEQGMHEEAAEHGAEALQLREGLLAICDDSSSGGETGNYCGSVRRSVPGAFGAALAVSLVHHAEWLFYEWGHPRSIAICGEAARWLRSVTEPGQFSRVVLARALLCQAGILFRVADLEAALHSATECVSVYRELTAESMAVPHIVGLVHALAIGSTVQLMAGQADAAMSSAEEAVSLAREVADSDGDRSALLAYVLEVSVSSLSHQDPSKAVPVMAEVLRLYRTLAKKDPAYRNALAAALAKHATLFLKCGRVESALPLSSESVSLATAREIAATRADKNVLALALGAQADVLKMSGLHVEALVAARKSADVTEEVVQQIPWLAPDLAEQQARISDILLAKGELRDSERMARIAMRTYSLFRRTYTPVPRMEIRLTISLVRALLVSRNFAASMRGIRRIDAALQEGAQVSAEEMANFQSLLSLHQWAASHREEAVASAWKAVTVLRAQVIRNPVLKLELATVLELHGSMAVERGDREVGLRSLQEAIALLTDLQRIGQGNDYLAPFRVRCLTSLGLAYHELMCDDDACAVMREALSLVRVDDLTPMALEIAVDAHMSYARILIETGAQASEIVRVARMALRLCEAAGSSDLVEQEAELVDLVRKLTNRSDDA
ncbi:hypothetical protein ACFYMI_09165 [Streptomyces collinus]|uniref:hypothetical protein n=1 Tax=Streptomyces collinus TaxID=42684 RepID=UPI0036C8D3C4